MLNNLRAWNKNLECVCVRVFISLTVSPLRLHFCILLFILW